MAVNALLGLKILINIVIFPVCTVVAIYYVPVL